jgi:hypothetical protein
MGKEAPLYAKGYRWDLTEVPSKHPMVTESEANDIADYFAEHNKDPRVKVGAFDLSKVTKFDATFGGMAYKAHACLGCHMIEENGKAHRGAAERIARRGWTAVRPGLALPFRAESTRLCAA